MILYNGGRVGLMSCDVPVTSEAGVKLYYRRLTETLPKLNGHHLLLAKSCQQVMSLAKKVI